MNANVTIKPAHSLTPFEIASCSQLNFGNNGMMQERFEIELANEKSNAMVVLYKARNHRILGWALVFNQHHRAKANQGAYLFVNAKWRKRGIGRALLKSIRQHIGKVQVFPHDERSRYFFHNFKDVFEITKDELHRIEQTIAA